MSESEAPPSPYVWIGGDPQVRRLVDRFYDAMDALPEAAGIRAMHARDLKVSRDKFFDFLSGWLGGPQRYIEKHGHPRLRRRHMPFAIGESEAEQWLRCMDVALEEVVGDADLRGYLQAQFRHTAHFMRNQQPPDEG